MNQEAFIEGEELITISKGGLVTLTTHRIRLERSYSGQSYIISMLLRKISSIEVDSKSIPLLWIMGAITGLVSIYGIVQEEMELFIPLIVLALLFFIGYYKSRKHLISIRSDGANKLQFRTQDLSYKEVVDFINQVESAMLKQQDNVR